MTSGRKHFVVIITFPDGPPPEDARNAQRDFLASLSGEGTLVLAGRFVDDRGGGMSIITADSLDAARERFSRSPLVEGDYVSWEVRELAPTFGLGAA